VKHRLVAVSRETVQFIMMLKIMANKFIFFQNRDLVQLVP